MNERREGSVWREGPTASPAALPRPGRLGRRRDACRTSVRDERGQSLAEFAIALPLLMLLIVGCFKAAILYNNYIQLTNSVDAGARLFSEERGQASPCSDAASEVAAAAGDLGTGSILISMSDNGSTSYQVYASAPGTPVSGSSCPTLNAADPATLSATYPCDLTVLGINFAPGCRLSATATESVQ